MQTMAGMTLFDMLIAPWAIVPEQLREMQAIYATHLRGETVDLEAIEARLGRPLANDQQEYQMRDGGVAVLPIEGAIAPKANLFMRVSGGASAQLLTRQVESAIADPRVRALVLSIDSPGGSVFGSPELAAAVRELSAVKPIVAVSDGTMASAAYWVGSAANAVFASGPTVQVGSIGVVATHRYQPEAGGKTTEITAGRYKRMGTQLEPLNDEARAYMQSQVDHLYSVFVDAVAANRGVTAEDVLQHMADGRIFTGQQAIDAGLIDGFATVDSVVQQLAANPQAFATRRRARIKGALASADPAPADPVVSPPTTQPKEPAMPGILHPDRAADSTEAIVAALAAEHPAVHAAIAALGATAERERIQAVRAQSMPGHEALVEQLAFDGKTTGPDAAMQVLAAERTAQAGRAKDLAAALPDALPANATATGGDDKPAAGKAPQPDPRAMADAIAKKQAEAQAAGRSITVAQAFAQVKKEALGG